MTTTMLAGNATIALLAAAGLSAEARILPRPGARRDAAASAPCDATSPRRAATAAGIAPGYTARGVFPPRAG